MRSSVDREGSLLRIEGPDNVAGLAARAAGIVEQMGYVAQPMEGQSHVSRWFDLATADELSQEEARVLTHRWIDDLGAEGVVKAPHRLIDPLRAALLEAFRSAARTGSIDDLDID